jgi:hypothetical protein
LFLENQENEGPHSYLDLIKIAEDYGVRLKGYKFESLDGLIPEIRKNQIIVTLKENNKLHAIIVYKIKHKKIYVFDPSEGYSFYLKDDFLIVWDKTALVVEGKNDIKKQIDIPKLFSKPIILLSLFFHVLTSLAVLLGIFFLSEDFWYGYSIIFFATAVICDLLFRSLSFLEFSKIDKLTSSNELSDKIPFKTYIERLEKFKKSFIEISTSTISSFIIIILISSLFIFNDFHNLYLVLFAIFISFINVIFFKKIGKKRIKEVKLKEQKILDNPSKIEQLNLYDELHKKAYKFGYVQYFEKILLAFIILLAIMLLLLFLGNFSFVVLAFYFFFTQMLIKNFNSLFSLTNTIDEYRLSKSSLLDAFKRK